MGHKRLLHTHVRGREIHTETSTCTQGQSLLWQNNIQRRYAKAIYACHLFSHKPKHSHWWRWQRYAYVYCTVLHTVDTPRTQPTAHTPPPRLPAPCQLTRCAHPRPMLNPCAHRCRPSLVPTYYAAGLPCAVVTILRVELLLEPRLYTHGHGRARIPLWCHAVFSLGVVKHRLPHGTGCTGLQWGLQPAATKCNTAYSSGACRFLSPSCSGMLAAAPDAIERAACPTGPTSSRE